VTLPAALWTWRGDLVAVLVAAVLLAALLLRRGTPAPSPRESAFKCARVGGSVRASREISAPESVGRPRYLATLRRLAVVPGALALLLVALLRTAAFMGYLAYLAALYDERFDLGPELVALVWTASGASFFLANLLAGRWINTGSGSPERAMVGGLAVAVAAMLVVHLVPVLPLALLGTVALGASHAVVAACVTTLLVRRCGDLRAAALSLNAAGMSLGVFAGAAVGGLGLAVAGFPGVGVALGAVTAAGLLASIRVVAARPDHRTSTGRRNGFTCRIPPA
jgi:predicted MFS family arabinose efflux permease